MVQSLQLGNPSNTTQEKGMKRLNRLPVFFGIGITVVVAAALVYGISSRGLRFGEKTQVKQAQTSRLRPSLIR